MSNQKNPFAAHLERKNDMGKCTAHFQKIPKHVCSHTAGCRESAPTRLLPASTRLRRRVCPDASATTRPRRRVHAEASAPTRLLRPVRAEPSSPTPIPRGLHRRVCADASAPTRLRRCVPSGASKYGFSLKNFDSARDLLNKLEKTLSEITTFAKNDHPYRSCGISAVICGPLQ